MSLYYPRARIGAPALPSYNVLLPDGRRRSLAPGSVRVSQSSVAYRPRVATRVGVSVETLGKEGLVRPNSYSFGIGDTLVTSLSWDSTRHVHLLNSWPENG